jgi:VWFA-related protein
VPSEINFSRRNLLSALLLSPCARLLIGQQSNAQQQPPATPPPATLQPATPQQNPTYTTDVKVVNLFATVRDKKGKIVSGLSKEDFLLDEDGRTQDIKFFTRESNLPLTLGLLIDTSGSQRNVLSAERTASLQFLGQVLKEDRDLAFLIHFDFEVELLQDLTPSRAKLEEGLNLLKVGQDPNQQQQQQGGNQGGNPGGGYPQGGGYPGGGYPRRRGGYPGGGYPPSGGGGGGRRAGTKLYDAILLACDELMKKQQGRKALVLLTDGVDHGSKSTLFQAIESAQRSDTLVYSVLFGGSDGGGSGFSGPGMGRRGGMGRPGGYGGGEDGKKVLQQIAHETGGGFFQVSHSRPIDKVFATIEEELRNQYSIGYTSNQPATNAVYRHIHLMTKNSKAHKDLVVQAREGYYPS